MNVIDVQSIGLDVKRISGNEALVICPFHNDTKPSASINLVSGQFYCFACGEKSTATEINGGVPPARTSLDLMPKNLKTFPNSDSDLVWRSRYELASSAVGHWYMDARGVSDKVVDEFKIKIDDDCVYFPFHNFSNSILNGVQTRSFEGKKYRMYGKRPPLWPMSVFASTPPNVPLFVTEGVFGALRGISCGAAAVSTLGASNTQAIRYAALRGNAFAIFDDDDAGAIASAKMAGFGGRFCIARNSEPDDLTDKKWFKLTSDVNKFFTGDIDFLVRHRPQIKDKILGAFYEAYRA